MTGRTIQRARLLRLRKIECRIAAANLSQAQATLTTLRQVTQRLAALNSGLTPAAGIAVGRSLKSNAEMSARLDAAAISMASPIGTAIAKILESQALHRKTRQREDYASKLNDSAKAQQEAARVLRADANRPFRKPANFLGEAL